MTVQQDTSKSTALFLSVGGSPGPLVSAMTAIRPDRVVFVVSDGSKGSPTSRAMVDEESIVYDLRSGRMGPGLSHLDVCPRAFSVVSVPPDDLDTALVRIDAALSAERRAGFPVVVDYTGGTKSMAAAMVLAASAHSNVQLQFMAGRRADLAQVEAGTESPVEMPGDLLGLGQSFASIRAFVARRQYGPALALADAARAQIDHHPKRVPTAWRGQVDAWRHGLKLLDAWDRFDHPEAHKLLSAGLDEEAPWALVLEAQGYADRLSDLDANRRSHPVLVEDLWLNAERRAENGLFDDAVARLYRLAESAVQSRLWQHHGIDAANAQYDDLPERLRNRLNNGAQHGRTGYALSRAEAVEVLDFASPGDPVAAAFRARPRWQIARNTSILAHGFAPLSRTDWTTARQWILQRRGILWEDLLGRPTAAQLPDTLPESET